ncbi:DUF896 family protein [Cohnella sp. CIP 111063]|jgi:Uncharacterized protein conserved in bacteria|uniref:DUF896 domain-containing protein n=1 Tax=unclassified Cohnella TaxID=2636738 RepID=UPI000B8BFD1C|nr:MULTISPECIES: DUF896 domain-containing protein [unclassified Cohnella]OXS61024.1 DUF896 family protein [Cohnella sp. CIP 111063]PRX73568.1 uncharacterized protein YnzC (UPF0291/DUF896 family) [Cohnella sp. SGD-V74]
MEMDQLINRINELSRKSKKEGLSEQEVAERDRLRKQYLSIFKSNFRQELDRIEIVDEPPIKH